MQEYLHIYKIVSTFVNNYKKIINLIYIKIYIND
jgi:hypothetical protein